MILESSKKSKLSSPNKINITRHNKHKPNAFVEIPGIALLQKAVIWFEFGDSDRFNYPNVDSKIYERENKKRRNWFTTVYGVLSFGEAPKLIFGSDKRKQPLLVLGTIRNVIF